MTAFFATVFLAGAPAFLTTLVAVDLVAVLAAAGCRELKKSAWVA